MDIHRNVDSDPDEVHDAHMSDLEAQEKYGVKYLKYWFNLESQTVCCLVDAPDPESAEKVHEEAHGLTADKIIEVDDEVVEAFLGGGLEAAPGKMITPAGEPDGGFRTVFFTDIVGSTNLTQQLGDEKAMQIIRIHDRIVRREIEAYGGRVIKHTGDGFMAAFPDASSAIRTAISTQKALHGHNQRSDGPPLQIRIGMSAGEPVDEGEDLFGATVQLARRVCDAGGAGDILISNVVRELCLGKNFEFKDRGPAELKGFTDPVLIHEVNWH